MPGPIASFWIGYAAGALSVIAGCAALVVYLIRRAPHRPDPAPTEPAPDPAPIASVFHPALIDCRDRQCGALAGEPVCSTCPAAGLTAEWNTRYPVPDVTTLVPQQKAEAPRFLDEIGTVTDDQWDQLNTRGPVTDYPPGVPHHDLHPVENPDGTTTYRRTDDRG